MDSSVNIVRVFLRHSVAQIRGKYFINISAGYTGAPASNRVPLSMCN